MKKSQYLFFSLWFIFSLSSCSWLSGEDKPNNQASLALNGSANSDTGKSLVDSLGELPLDERKKHEAFIKSHCLTHDFGQTDRENLYGKDCIRGMLSIRTSTQGTVVATSQALMDANVNSLSNSQKGGEASSPSSSFESDFNKRIYKTAYQILDTEDSQINPLLTELLRPTDTEKDEFIGFLNQEYQILFKLRDNWLVIFKASQDKNLIPYMERTSEDPALKAEGWHAVPLYGYPVQYCNAEQKEVRGVKTTEFKKDDCNARLEDAQYVYINRGQKKVYEYVPKRDLLPSDYFDGRWFFAKAVVKSSFDVKEMLYTSNAYVVEAKKGTDFLYFMDKSGDVETEAQKEKYKMPIEWKEYKMGGNFQEEEEQMTKLIEDTAESVSDEVDKPEDTEEETSIKTIKVLAPYLLLNFTALLNEGEELTEIFVLDDFFSFVIESTSGNTKEQTKYSFLRESALDDSGFKEKRWFKDDHEKYFGILPAWPQNTPDNLDDDDSRFSHFKQFQFNINGTKGKAPQTIKWYFSENSTRDEFYRDIAREAVNIYNQAFNHISNGEIKVTLVENEGDKNLGDIRYNLINLLDRKTYSGVGLFGVAPSFSNPDTGQTIGSVANVAIHKVVDSFELEVKKYIQYEIFRKHKKTKWENELHAVSPYLKSQIESQCKGEKVNQQGEILAFIKQHITLRKAGQITPQSPLGRDLGKSEDEVKELISTCAKKISKNYILMLVLHEMGHNFGLAHNFKASADEDNYWKSKDDIETVFNLSSLSPLALDENNNLSEDERLPKSSSVMDYLPLDVLPLTYLGKYDIAALRFLYVNELEVSDADQPIEITDFSSSLSDKISNGTLKNLKKYMHCSKDNLPGDDENINITNQEDLLCFPNDYGSSILEKVQFSITNLKRLLYNEGRYYYDTKNITKDSVKFINQTLKKLQPFYRRWISLRDDFLNYLNVTGIDRYQISDHRHKVSDTCTVEVENPPVGTEIHNNPSVSSYLEAIEKGKTESSDPEEYQAFYAIREPIADFFMELLFLESMKCKVQPLGSEDGKSSIQWVELEMVRKYLKKPNRDRWAELQKQFSHFVEDNPFIYIEDCYSPAIKDFFEANGLEVIGQAGLEKFSSFYPEEHSLGSQKNDILSIFEITARFSVLAGTEDFIYSEPDFFEKFRLKAEEHILKLENVSLFFGDSYYTKMINHVNITDQTDIDDSEIRETNLNYFRVAVSSPESFRNGVENIIRESGVQSSTIRSSYIKESYKNFIGQLTKPSSEARPSADVFIGQLTTPSSEEGNSTHHLPLSDTEKNMCLNGPVNTGICQLTQFEHYIRSLNTSAEKLNIPHSFAFPLENDSFAEQLIKMYNCKISERENLTDGNLSDLEKIDKDYLDNHISILKSIIRHRTPRIPTAN